MDIMEYPRVLLYMNTTYIVSGKIGEVEKYNVGECYIGDDDYVYLYVSNKEELKQNKFIPTCMYEDFDTTKKIVTKRTRSGEVMESFHINKTTGIGIGDISTNTPDDLVLYDEDLLEDLNAPMTEKTIIINETDDFLKKVIKTAIIVKKINLNRLRHRMPTNYAFSNLLSGLTGKTKMSVLSFLKWVELLGLDFEVVLKDNGRDEIDPLPNDIKYDGNTATVKMKEGDGKWNTTELNTK